ncbi:MAG TPA: tRNA (adenosine(37)-N6)-threonylcarbamoyltransferase complex ATPase subunit type 1 TsaE, partial [Dehalococcoidia bacterium]|nr:tRNA (adenosine(37)-N6)-threonylcarbamoyltransferase complex ATPase subunit type 1 TsaE [Dehalococcoidia bacterium]
MREGRFTIRSAKAGTTLMIDGNFRPDSAPTPALLLVSDSELETVRIGSAIGQALRSGDTVLLSGELGAGKTRLVHGMAEGIESTITARSPTFVIVNEYPGRIRLSHCDLYRIGS